MRGKYEQSPGNAKHADDNRGRRDVIRNPHANAKVYDLVTDGAIERRYFGEIHGSSRKLVYQFDAKVWQ